MVRIQLHLTSEQDRALRALARARGTTRAELIRTAIDGLLRQGGEDREPLADLVGALTAGPRRQTSEEHDDLLYRRSPLSVPLVPERRRPKP